jgi:ATP-dependent Lhr-like helicase
MASQLLTRHGVVTREVASLEQLPGGFSLFYPVLRRLEETGRVRRGYFIERLGAAQFAQPGALDLLRAGRDGSPVPRAMTLAATDPAQPYGWLVPWPAWGSARGAMRSAGARVLLVDGVLTAWIARGDHALLISLPLDEPARPRAGRALAAELVALAHRMPEGQRGWLIEQINGAPAASAPEASFLIDAGFRATGLGLQLRVPRRAEAEGDDQGAS